eukprot:gene31089-39003_t
MAWKQHKKSCSAFKLQEKNRAQEILGDVISPEVGALQDAVTAAKENNEECSICLGPFNDPVRLTCGHLFCLPCVTRWHTSRIDASANCIGCPQCRETVVDPMFCQYNMYSKIMQKANKKYKKGSEEYLTTMNLVGAKIDELIAAIPEEEDHARVLQQWSRADNHMHLGEFTKAKSLIEKAITETTNKKVLTRYGLRLDEIGSSEFSTQTILSNLNISLAECCNKMEDWQGACEALQRSGCGFRSGINDDIHAQRKVFHYGCIAYGELGMYDVAIQCGEAAILMNRHYVGVYRPLVNCYTAQGKFDEAIKWMRKAVAFETPWDDENVAKLKAYLQELVDTSRTHPPPPGN